MENEAHYVVSHSLLQAVVGILDRLPYNQVYMAMDEIRKLRPEEIAKTPSL